ncbi:MAG: hypothetical protein ACREM6_15425 [Vulcanimicrobiaceae bacterium]
MPRPLAFSALAGLACALAACGGGGGTPSPTPTPTPGALLGATANLTGQIVQTVVRPFPAPSATIPPATTTTMVAVVAKIASTTASFNGQSNLVDANTVETDTGGLQTLTVTTDTFAAIVPITGGTFNLLSYGSNATDSNGTTFLTKLGTGNGLLDIQPDKNAASWQNNAAETYAETEPDSTTIARIVNADGTYRETDTFAATPTFPGQFSPEQIVTKPDLSAAITNLGGQTGLNVAFGVPTGSGTSAKIPLTVVVPVPVGTPTTQQLLVPDWYPAPPTIASDGFVKSTGVATPAICAVPPSVGSPATAVAETLLRLDTALGVAETRTTTAYYVYPFGLVCAQMNDVLNAYYDFSGQSPAFFAGSPQQVTTTVETLGFTSGSPAGTLSDRRAASLGPAAALQLVAPVFDRTIARIYDRQRRALRGAARSNNSILFRVMGR